MGSINVLSDIAQTVKNADSALEKFDWCPLAPIFREFKPFGECVEGLSHFGYKSCAIKAAVRTFKIVRTPRDAYSFTISVSGNSAYASRDITRDGMPDFFQIVI
jgi:hypothetical protein